MVEYGLMRIHQTNMATTSNDWQIYIAKEEIVPHYYTMTFTTVIQEIFMEISVLKYFCGAGGDTIIYYYE